MEDEQTLQDRLARLEAFDTELLRTAYSLLRQYAEIYQTDLFIMGALKRTFAQSKGFRDLVMARNFPCAAAILRMQLDTAMRINALLLVDDREVLCRAVLDGQKMNGLKDRSGKKMSDAYLRGKLSENNPWINQVYEQTSDLVHLSGRHFYSSITSLDESTHTIRFVISAEDPPRAEEDYFEITDTFVEISKLAGLLILEHFSARF